MLSVEWLLCASHGVHVLKPYHLFTVTPCEGGFAVCAWFPLDQSVQHGRSDEYQVAMY